MNSLQTWKEEWSINNVHPVNRRNLDIQLIKIYCCYYKYNKQAITCFKRLHTTNFHIHFISHSYCSKESTNLHAKKNCLAHEVKTRQDYKALTRLWLPSVCHFYFQMNPRKKQMSVTFVSITIRWWNSKSPQKIQYRSGKDLQQKQSLVVRQPITAKDSQQKPQGFEAKAIAERL